MFATLQRQLGTAGLVVAIVALVAALGGGAYAATQSGAKHKSNAALTSKQKKEVTKIAKQYAGKPGAAGAKGAPGAEGKQGPQGDPGPLLETLPAGKTETGSWGTMKSTEDSVETGDLATLSFPIPLASAPSFVLIIEDGTGFTEGHLPMSQAEIEAACGSGSAAAPEAKPGNLCVYVTEEEETTFPTLRIATGAIAATSFGLNLPIFFNSGGEYSVTSGTWAVTAG